MTFDDQTLDDFLMAEDLREVDIGAAIESALATSRQLHEGLHDLQVENGRVNCAQLVGILAWKVDQLVKPVTEMVHAVRATGRSWSALPPEAKEASLRQVFADARLEDDFAGLDFVWWDPLVAHNWVPQLPTDGCPAWHEAKRVRMYCYGSMNEQGQASADRAEYHLREDCPRLVAAAPDSIIFGWKKDEAPKLQAGRVRVLCSTCAGDINTGMALFYGERGRAL